MQASNQPTPLLHWRNNDIEQSAQWRSEAGLAPPKSVIVVDDRLPADTAYRYACEGTALLWSGDFQNAKHLLQALIRRIDHKPKKASKRAKAEAPTQSIKDKFHLNRQAKAQRARILGMILIPLDADYTIPLRRAPDLKQACTEAYGPANAASIVSLRELLSLVGAHEWRKAGVEIPAIGARIHPHFGVFSPVRGEYIDLVLQAPLPSTTLAFDIGTGTGVLAAVLAKRGITRIIATELDPRALDCAQENIERLNLKNQIELLQTDLFPSDRAKLIVCNPPWLPTKPSSPIEAAIYDPDSRMLRGFLSKLAEHLEDNGEGWLILSDLAEHLGLRTREELLSWISAGNLQVIDKLDTRPKHGKARDTSDPLYTARSAEITSLWRLAKK